MNRYEPWKPPFQYNADIAAIEDATGNRVLDVRGWGYLTGKGSQALGLDEESAINIQNNIGIRVAQLMNNDTTE